MIRLNVTIPEDLVRELKPIKNKSRFIADALRERFASIRWKRLEAQMIEGYKASAKDDKKISLDWDSAVGDGLND